MPNALTSRTRWLVLLVSTLVDACTLSRPLQLHTPNHALLAAASRRRHEHTRRHKSVSPFTRALDTVVADPVPALGVAALVAAAGPAVLRAARNGRPHLQWPFASRRSSITGMRSALTVDGALDDSKTVASARALLALWEEGGTDQAQSASAIEAALGLLALDFAQRGGEDAKLFRRLVRLVAMHSRGPQQTGGALRKATTAAARKAFGSGRDGNALATSQRDSACGALLLLCRALLPQTSLEAQAEAAALEAGVRRAFFGFEGEEERGARLRDEGARRLFSLEARRVLRASGAGTGGAPAILRNSTWREALDELPGLLRMEPASFVGPLLLLVEDLLHAELERALAAWIRAGGRSGLPEAADLGESGPLLEQRAQADAMERAAFAMAASAARLASWCLELGGTSTPTGLGDSAVRLAQLRSVGLLSPARHRFYQALVRNAVFAEVAGMATDGALPEATNGSESTSALTVNDCVVLRRLLAVLPTSAATGASAALQAAAGSATAASVDLSSIERRLAL